MSTPVSDSARLPVAAPAVSPVAVPARSPVADRIRHGLYDPANEHDNCGVAFVVDMHGRRSHQIVQQGLAALCQLDHRGATGAEANVGDGAGILIQVPDAFLRAVCDFDLPDAGTYAVGLAFLPKDPDAADVAAKAIEDLAVEEGLRVVGWRDVPVDTSGLGSFARDVEPTFRHMVVAAAEDRDP
jgi:glutamate synthase (NADPH) large chain